MSVVYKGKTYNVETNKKGQLTLNLWGLGILDIFEIEGLYNLNNLEVLLLFHNKITEIKGLDSLSNLQELDLSGNNIKEIKGLENLINLRVLKIINNQIDEIKGLERNTNLLELNLRKNRITEIKGLDSIKSLEKLDLNSNLITEIKGLSKLTNLNELNLNNNKIYAIKGLESLNNLNKLYLDMNPVWKWTKKKFGQSVSGYGMVKDPQEIAEFCRLNPISQEKENEKKSAYHKKLKIYSLLAIIGMMIMSIGPFFLYQSIYNVLGWISTIIGTLMVIIFVYLAKFDKIYKIIFGIIGIIIVIVGLILSVMNNTFE